MNGKQVDWWQFSREKEKQQVVMYLIHRSKVVKACNEDRWKSDEKKNSTISNLNVHFIRLGFVRGRGKTDAIFVVRKCTRNIEI